MKAVLVLTMVLAVMNTYLAISARHKLADGARTSLLVVAIFVAFYALQLVAPWLDWSRTPIEHRWSGAVYDLLVQSSYLALGVLSCLLLYSIAVDVLWLVLKWILPVSLMPSLRFILFMIVIGATGASVGAGLRYAGTMAVTRVDLPLKSLPPSFDGFTIAQISDLHVGPHLRRSFVQKLVDEVTALNPDMIALTGDLADGRPAQLSDDVAPLASLAAPFGKFYITGNHEYYWGAEAWIEHVKTLGFHAMMNDAITFQRGDGALVVAGVPDTTSIGMRSAVQTDPVAAIKDAPPLATKILLAHQAKVVDSAREAGFDAQLSGHSHAGQYFPFTVLIRWVVDYTQGHYDVGGLKLYVNKGVGFWGPPLRSGGPGEITLFTLKREE